MCISHSMKAIYGTVRKQNYNSSKKKMQRQPQEVFSQKRCFQKFQKFEMKALALNSLFSKEILKRVLSS